MTNGNPHRNSKSSAHAIIMSVTATLILVFWVLAGREGEASLRSVERTPREQIGGGRAPLLVPEAVQAVPPRPLVAVADDVPIAPAPELARETVIRRLLVRVLDEQNMPVSNALVQVWLATEDETIVPQSREVEWNLESLMADYADRKFMTKDTTWRQPLHTLLTDDAGTCVVEADMNGTIVVASKDGIGASGRWEARHNKKSEDEILIHLRRVGQLTLQVVDSAGVPIGGALVEFDPLLDPRVLVRARKPLPVYTDADGLAEVEVDAPFCAWTRAKIQVAASERQVICLEPGQSTTVTLTLGCKK